MKSSPFHLFVLAICLSLMAFQCDEDITPLTQEEEREEIKEDQEESQEEMKKSNSSKSAKKKKDAAQKMKKMAQAMSMEMESQEMEQMEEDMAALRQLLENLVGLSFEQEDLIEEVTKTTINTPRYVDLTQHQFMMGILLILRMQALLVIMNSN